MKEEEREWMTKALQYTVRRLLLRTSSHVICGNYYTQHYDVFNEHGMGLLLASENSNKRKFN